MGGADLQIGVADDVGHARAERHGRQRALADHGGVAAFLNSLSVRGKGAKSP